MEMLKKELKLNEMAHDVCKQVCGQYECNECPIKDDICVVKEITDIIIREYKRANTSSDLMEVAKHISNVIELREALDKVFKEAF